MIAVNRTLSIHQRNFLKMLISNLDIFNSYLKHLEVSIYADRYWETVATSIIPEIDIDSSYFKTVEYICSWPDFNHGDNQNVSKKMKLDNKRKYIYLYMVLAIKAKQGIQKIYHCFSARTTCNYVYNAKSDTLYDNVSFAQHRKEH